MRRFRDLGITSELKDSVTALGCDFCRRRDSADRPTGNARVQQAITIASRIAMLCINPSAGRRFFTSLCSSKAAWGWWFRAPAPALLRRLRQLYRRCVDAHGQASRWLFSLLEGHAGNIDVKSGMDAASALRRVVCKCSLHWRARAERGTWQGRVRSFLSTLDWEERGAWHWEHADLGHMRWNQGDTDRQRGRDAHLIRESWRRCMLRKFLAQTRRDSAFLRASFQYDELRVKQAVDCYNKGSPDERAVLLGAACSVAFW